MVAAALVPAIREAIKQNEIGRASPYCLSFARSGKSGGSFGVFQGDAHANSAARATLQRVLESAGVASATADRIVATVSRLCPDGNPLAAADAKLADDALASDAGRPLVDAMDEKLLAVVLGHLDGCIAAAASRGLAIDPPALLPIALWVNMTGPPDTLKSWLGGTPEMGLAPPAGPAVTRADIERYLQACAFFRDRPRNFAHLRESVQVALAEVPAGMATV
jgi:hypothetical protein